MASPYRAIIEAMFMIVNKDGVSVPFRLNGVQSRLDAEWSRRNIIPKARQEGVSSYVIARYIAKCLAEENRTCVIVSHEADATARLLSKAKYTLDHLKGDLKPKLGTNNVRAITFLKTNSSLWIGTAGSRNFGHGDTITDLHLSEAARYADAGELAQGLFPATERGEITIESTGNGVGNWYHKQCLRAREGHGFKLFFFPWTDDPDYALDNDEPFTPDIELEEPDLIERGISIPQLRWRREKIGIDFEGDIRKFKASYPIDFDECFQSTGYSFFRNIRFKKILEWKQESRHLWVLGNHPKPGMSYVIGADSSGGVDRDNAVAEIFCIDTREQVAEWVSGAHEPDQFGTVLAELGQRFNHAYINGERNNHGLVTLRRLIDIYPIHLIHRGSYGGEATQVVLNRLDDYWTLTTPTTRGLLIDAIRTALRDEYTIHSEMLKSECGTFVEQKDGKIEADSGCHDDRVFAAAEAFVCMERAAIMTGPDYVPVVAEAERDPFGFDALFGKQTTEAFEHAMLSRFG